MEQKTLTRKELYKLAWEKPMIHIAKEFGFSDRRLGKLFAMASVLPHAHAHNHEN